MNIILTSGPSRKGDKSSPKTSPPEFLNWFDLSTARRYIVSVVYLSLMNIVPIFAFWAFGLSTNAYFAWANRAILDFFFLSISIIFIGTPEILLESPTQNRIRLFGPILQYFCIKFFTLPLPVFTYRVIGAASFWYFVSTLPRIHLVEEYQKRLLEAFDRLSTKYSKYIYMDLGLRFADLAWIFLIVLQFLWLLKF